MPLGLLQSHGCSHRWGYPIESQSYRRSRRCLYRLLLSLCRHRATTTYELDSSHVPMLSQPERVIDAIRAAAKAAQEATAAA